jgi:hypothetical protein
MPLSTPLKEVFSDPCWNVSGPLLRLGEYGKRTRMDESVQRVDELYEGDGALEEEDEEEEDSHGFIHVEYTDDEDDEDDDAHDHNDNSEEDYDDAQYARRTTLEINNNLVIIYAQIHS